MELKKTVHLLKSHEKDHVVVNYEKSHGLETVTYMVRTTSEKQNGTTFQGQITVFKVKKNWLILKTMSKIDEILISHL